MYLAGGEPMKSRFSRRAFVGALAPVAMGVGVRGVWGGESRFPFFALCMDTHDSKKRSLAEQAALLSDLGYDGAGHLWLDNVRERLDTLDAAHLKLFQIYITLNVGTGAKQPYDPRLSEVLPLLKNRGTSIAVLVSGGKPSDEALDQRAVELVREMAGMAQPYGVRVALYPHVRNWVERVEDAVRVARKADRPNVGAMFNLCHWLKIADESQLTPLLETAMPHLFAVTINGTDTGAEIKSGKGNWIQPLDAGSYDIYGFLRTLKGLGYAGPIGLQCYGIQGDAREHLTRSIAAWRSLSQKLNNTGA
jgi:sugar phosphate isomerase/epimerase